MKKHIENAMLRKLQLSRPRRSCKPKMKLSHRSKRTFATSGSSTTTSRGSTRSSRRQSSSAVARRDSKEPRSHCGSSPSRLCFRRLPASKVSVQTRVSAQCLPCLEPCSISVPPASPAANSGPMSTPNPTNSTPTTEASALSASPTTAAQLGQQQALPSLPATAAHLSPATPVANAVVTVVPPVPPSATAPAVHAICPKCWSVSCRCPPASGCRAASGGIGMEIDQERGAKRSCVEAALPERTSGGQPSAGALLVVSSGTPAKPAAVDGEPPAVAVEGGPSAVAAEEKPQPVSVQVELERQTGPEAAEEGGGAPCDSALPESQSKDQDAAVDAEKDNLRKSFSALVIATCSHRAYPY